MQNEKASALSTPMLQRIYLIGAGASADWQAAAAWKLPVPVEVKAADPSAEARALFKKKHPRAVLFSDAEEMLREPSRPNDFVIISTPVFLHYPQTMMALQSGRHVLCEKPMGITRAELLGMYRLAKQKKLQLGDCVSRILGRPVTKETKQFLHTGALGNIYYVNQVYRHPRCRAGIEYQPPSKWYMDKSKAGGGELINHAVYDMAVLNDIFRPVQIDVLSGWMSNVDTWLDLPPGTVFDVEEQVGLNMRFHLSDGHNFIVNIERALCTHAPMLHVLEFQGMKGALTVNQPEGPSGYRCEFTHCWDEHGKQVTKQKTIDLIRNYGEDEAVHPFYAHLQGVNNAHALVNERAIFNSLVLMAGYECINSGQRQTVTLGDVQ